jgi:DNA-3-methyladenine glycosylase I
MVNSEQSDSTTVSRCDWALGSELMTDYHDREWAVPLHDDRQLFELLTLEGAQAGLSWSTILIKREGYRALFQDFDSEAVAAFGPHHIDELLLSPLIIRNRAKVEATVENARALRSLSNEFGSFDRYLWAFVGGKPLQNSWQTSREIPSESEQSRALSKDLRNRGFKFVGPTICYAFMQAAGLVNDHLVSCFRYQELRQK